MMLRWNIAFSTLLVAFLSIRFTEGITSPYLQVTLKNGDQLIGRHFTSHYGRNVRGFIGIPYAKPPVGDLRFRAPVPFGAWNGTRMAITDTPKCIQVFNGLEGSEDCLYLSVYTPEQPLTNQSLPVMVWIHGGSFEFGTPKMYNPKYLMDREVIFVSIAYRVGPIGFMSTETPDCPGNFGLKDQTMALKWVQDNIAAFGGDPKRVTAIGESAGSAAVALHTISTLSKGLFQRGIGESGGPYDPWVIPALPGVPSSRATKIAQMVNCDTSSGNWTTIIACLRGKPAADIAILISNFTVSPHQTVEAFPPVVEPKSPQAFLTKSPRATSYSNSIPVLFGFNKDEALYKTIGTLNDQSFKDNIRQQLPIVFNYADKTKQQQDSITSSILNFYLKDGANFDFQNYKNITDMFSDNIFIYGFGAYINSRLKANAATYAYTFDNKGFASFSEYIGNPEHYMGTCHGDEMLYLFPMNDDFLPTASPTARDAELRERFLDLWCNFATTGNPTPSNSSLPTWTPVNSYPPTLMRIGINSQNGTLLQMSNDFPLERVEFWRNLGVYNNQLKVHDEDE